MLRIRVTLTLGHHKLGHGGFGDVYLGDVAVNEQQHQVAVKALRDKDPREAMLLYLEVVEAHEYTRSEAKFSLLSPVADAFDGSP